MSILKHANIIFIKNGIHKKHLFEYRFFQSVLKLQTYFAQALPSGVRRHLK